MPSRRLSFAAAGLIMLVGDLVSCSAPRPLTTADSGSTAREAWVVVAFEDRDDEMDQSLMDALLDTELAADQALAAADAGWIDGNEIGMHTYELYFTGEDPREMWRTLEPVFDAAPVAWSRVELRRGFDDPSPEILVQDETSR